MEKYSQRQLRTFNLKYGVAFLNPTKTFVDKYVEELEGKKGPYSSQELYVLGILHGSKLPCSKFRLSNTQDRVVIVVESDEFQETLKAFQELNKRGFPISLEESKNDPDSYRSGNLFHPKKDWIECLENSKVQWKKEAEIYEYHEKEALELSDYDPALLYNLSELRGGYVSKKLLKSVSEFESILQRG